MKTKLSKQEAKEKIEVFFKQPSFTQKELKKIRRLAMKFKIPLREKRRKFCKSCLRQLKGKTRVSSTHKTVTCSHCNYENKFRILKKK
jgi:RNase P subunit RPR2